MKETIAAIRDAINKECWLPALALALTIPDVLGQIAYPDLKKPNGERSVTQQYKRWFHENVEHCFADNTGYDENGNAKRPYFTADMCFKLRNAFLHAGNDDIEFEYGNREEDRDYEYDFELRVHACNSFGSLWAFPREDKRVTERVCVSIDIKTLCDALCEEAERFLLHVSESELECHSIRVVDVEEFAKLNPPQ